MRNTRSASIVATLVLVVTSVVFAPASTLAAYPKPDIDMNDLSFYHASADVQPYPASRSRTVRNVIFCIGDGMGLGQVALARIKATGLGGKLHMERMPISGLVRTHSADNLVTDSAASGTALACGVKTNNEMIGMTPDRKEHQSLLEAAKAKGMATGLVRLPRQGPRQ